jgi:adenine specific DNA methylase Mod
LDSTEGDRGELIGDDIFGKSKFIRGFSWSWSKNRKWPLKGHKILFYQKVPRRRICGKLGDQRE